MASTGIVRGSLSSAYEHSFGNLPDKTVYQDLVNDVDMRPELKAQLDQGMKNAEAELKALITTAGGPGTAGNALIPVYVDPRIVDRTRKFTPWVELIPRVTNLGKEADFNFISSKASAVAAAEDAALADVTDTEDRSSTSIKYLYAVGRVTGQMQASMPSYLVQGLQPSGTGTNTASFNSPSAPNAKQYEVLKRAQSLRELEENMLWTGDAGTTATEFNGIVDLQDTTNQLDKSGAALDWDDVEEIAEYAYTDSGRPGVAGCDASTLRDLREIMVDHFRFRPGDLSGTAGFGVPSSIVMETMLGPIPVVPSQYLSTTTSAKQLFLLDMEYIEMRVLQDMTYEELAKTNDSQKFMLKIYEALLLRAPQFNAFVDNIA